MKGGRIILGSLSIRTKLILIIVITLCIPFTLFGLIWYHKSTNVIEENAKQSSMQIIQQLNNHLEFYFEDLDRTTIPMIMHPLIQRFIEDDITDTYDNFYLEKKIKQEVIPNVFFSRPDIYGITLVLKNGRKLSYGSTPTQKYSIDAEQLAENNIGIVSASKDGVVPILTLVRKIVDLDTYEPAGLLFTDIKLNELTKIINNSNVGETGLIWMVNSEGEILYHSDESKMGDTIPADELINYNNLSHGTYTKSDDAHETVVTFSQSDVTGIITVAEVSKTELMHDLFNLRNITIFFVILNIGFSLFIIGGFSLYIVNSLRYLQNKMNQVELGDLSVRVKERNNDELGKLNKSFNKMVNEMERLVKVVHQSELKEKERRIREREAKLQSMQFQINPHFLYNTLEVINSSAIVSGVSKISRMAIALADMFRYAVEGNKETVTLEEELENINRFIEIQQERYPYLQVEYSFHDTLLSNVKSIKLTLQPIIENAFKNGYTQHHKKPEHLKVSGQTYKDYFLLEVEDRGGGMSKETLERYNHIFKLNDLDKMNQVSEKILDNKIGLWNVHFRIRNAFGTPFGLFIKKSDATGTIVQIRLPFIKS